MTSVFSHWLSGKALFFRYISAIPPGWSGGYLTPLQNTLLSSLNNNNLRALHVPSMHNQFSLKSSLIFQHCLPLIKLLTYTYTACVSSIPPHIPTLAHTAYISLNLRPTYIYTAYISFNLSPHIHHIPTQAASHLSPDLTAKSSSR